jgi:hypothetical protein
MTIFAPTTQIADGNAKSANIGSAFKAASAVAVVGIISLFSLAQMSGTPFAPSAADLTHQSELRGLLCRIDHRCPSAGDAPARQASKSLSDAPSVAADLVHQSELRDLLCRIDHRCPSAGDVAARGASKVKTAENIVR